MTKDYSSFANIVIPFAEHIGFKVTEFSKGRSKCVLKTSKQLMNPNMVIHGGALYSLADTGMGAALFPCLEDDESCATIENKIMYFKPVVSGDVICESRLIHKGKSIAGLESEIFNNGELVAKAFGSFTIFKTKHRPVSY